MLIRIDPGSDEPIYLQIASAIETQIESGAVAPGERLPAARSLAESIGVNVHTVLKAYSHLGDRSLVEMRRGRGGVIVRDRPDVEKKARELVAAARRSGLNREQVTRLITEVWR